MVRISTILGHFHHIETAFDKMLRSSTEDEECESGSICGGKNFGHQLSASTRFRLTFQLTIEKVKCSTSKLRQSPLLESTTSLAPLYSVAAWKAESKTLSHLPSADNRLLCQSPPFNLSGLIRILFLNLYKSLWAKDKWKCLRW
ncbi:gamma-aminobutyraldehyde dehydrogenase [Striga asiatica]|uniref:Gamma-aminobutyraldehyde dehydrogenase n=1 Tax=Striga asiatica TaxID=4170 RepID=A0A5A7QV41_STRAF|nr:gamma-aminobutyraldehyde dehydrogenase [Striga asiatica]